MEKVSCSLLECPITGGLEALKQGQESGYNIEHMDKIISIAAGQMAVWVGGDKEAYTKVRPVLDASYSSVMYTGGLGTAMIPKVNTA